MSPLPRLPASVKTKLRVLGTSTKGPRLDPRPRPQVPAVSPAPDTPASRGTPSFSSPKHHRISGAFSDNEHETSPPAATPLSLPAPREAEHRVGLARRAQCAPPMPPRDPRAQPRPGGEEEERATKLLSHLSEKRTRSPYSAGQVSQAYYKADQLQESGVIMRRQTSGKQEKLVHACPHTETSHTAERQTGRGEGDQFYKPRRQTTCS